MRFSVVIPVYNRTDTLRTAIESVLCQTFKDYEIIVVDDGSDLSVAHCLRPYMGLINYIRHDRNQGVSAARNTGIRAAKGDYIAFLDSDDVWLPTKLQKQNDIFDKGWLFCFTDEFWYKTDRFVNQTDKHAKYGGQVFSKLLDMCRMSPSSTAMHRSVFMSCGFFDSNMRVCEDYDLWLRISAKHHIHFIQEKLIIRRAVTDDQLSKNIMFIESIRLVSLARLVRCKKLTLAQKKAAMNEISRKFDIVQSGIKRF
ncbi:glycosyltransferase family A protein [Seleniivibrio sp.]|uniref:glycosyltransferase family 2 protein n=1 Tax=Seleniivibrio sp. TaxID=2898801 RepID=UPI0025FD3482|nr:glycosyltransferase family A protein [Seleniivibrio sp.]MCD8553984.1 glycosyltransferase family 2 protein [Seleniivibrio sp.]